MKFLYTRLDFPYPLFVTTVNSLAGFLVVTTQAIADAVRKQWKQSPAEGPASRCEGDEEVDQKNQMNTIGTTSGSASAHVGEQQLPQEDTTTTKNVENAPPHIGCPDSEPLPHQQDRRLKIPPQQTLGRLAAIAGVLHGFSYAGMNVALHRLDSVTFGMLAKNVLLMDLFVFFLLDALAAAELVSQVKGSLFEPVRVVVVEDAKEKREEKTAAEVAGVYPRAGETATQDECEDDDMGASTKRTTTEEQADAEIKRKGQADRRRIPIQDYGSTARWAMTRPASAIANTTSASAEPPPAKLPSLEDQEGRFLFPWQRLRAGRRFLLQLFVITLGATGSVVLATLVTPSRGIKGINDPELQAVFSGSLLRPAASRDPVFAVLVLVVALLLTSAGQAILLYCTSPALRVLPQYLRRLVYCPNYFARDDRERDPSIVPAAADPRRRARGQDDSSNSPLVPITRGTQPTTATATNKLSALECSTRMAFAQFLTLCVLCAALEGVDRPLRLLFLETNRTRCLVLGFCSLLGLAVSLTFAQLAKLAGTSSVLTGCFRYVNFGVLAVFSALILHTRISPDQIACSLLMLLGAGSIAADAASPQGLFLSDVESPLPEGGEGGVGDHPGTSKAASTDQNQKQVATGETVASAEAGASPPAAADGNPAAADGAEREPEREPAVPVEENTTRDSISSRERKDIKELRSGTSSARILMSVGDWTAVFLAGVVAVANLAYLWGVVAGTPGNSTSLVFQPLRSTISPSSHRAATDSTLNRIYGKYEFSPKYADMVQLLRDFHRFTTSEEIFGKEQTPRAVSSSPTTTRGGNFRSSAKRSTTSTPSLSASSGGSDYTILCGTALGFWRHPGFLIPYDDDVDVAVPRSFWERVLKYALDRGLGARKTDHSEGEGARTGSVVEDRQMWVLASIPSGSSLTTTAPAPPKTTVAIVYQSRHLASADEIFEKSGATYVLVIDSHIVKECVRDLLGRDEAAKFAEGDLEWGADDPVLGKWGNKWEISDGRHPTNVMAAGFGGRFFMRHVVNPKELAAAAEAHKREQRASDVKRKLEAWEAGGAGDTSEVVMTEEEAVALLVEQRNAEEGWTGEKKQAYMTEHGGRWFTHVDVWADLSQWDFCGESSWNHQMLADADFPETELVRYCGVPVRAFSTSTKRARGWGLGGLAPGPPQVQRAGQTQHTGKGENDRGSPRISWAKGENLLKRHLRTCYGNDLGPPKHGVTLEFDANAFDAFREQVSGVLSPVASWFSSLFR